MNGGTVRNHAQYLAGRLIDEYPDDKKKQIEQLYLRLYSRPPTTGESSRALRALVPLQRTLGCPA